MSYIKDLTVVQLLTNLTFCTTLYIFLQISALTICIMKILAIISCLCKKGCICRRKTPRCCSLSRKAIIMATLLLGLHPTGRIIPPRSEYVISLSTSSISASVVSIIVTFSGKKMIKGYLSVVKMKVTFPPSKTWHVKEWFTFYRMFHSENAGGSIIKIYNSK